MSLTDKQTDKPAAGKNITSLVEVKRNLMLHFKEQDMKIGAQLVCLLESTEMSQKFISSLKT